MDDPGRTTRTPKRRGLAGRIAAFGVPCLLPLILSRALDGYPFELLGHFQLQYFLASAACAVVLAAARSRWCYAAVACVLLSGSAVAPYRPLDRAAYAATAPGNLRMLLVNVLKTNREFDRVLELVRSADADVVVFQEVDAAWAAALAPLGQDYPFHVPGDRRGVFGIAVYSRVPIEEATVRTVGGVGRPTVSMRLAVDGAPVSIVATHPRQPLNVSGFRERNAQLEAVADRAAGLPRPLVVIGDLNTTMWSPWFRRLCARNDLTDARRGLGVKPSWPAWLPAAARIPIDHCLVSGEIGVVGCRLGADVGSDHLPLIVDLDMPNR